MRHFDGNLADLSLPAVVRRLYLTRRTGELQLRSEDRGESLFFVGGDLYLGPQHPLAAAARQLLSEGGAGEAPSDGATRAVPARERAAADWRELAAGMVEAMESWDAGSLRFVEGTERISTELEGPLPTALVVMEGAVRGRDEFHLLRRLGGEESVLVAAPSAEREATVDLDPEEAFLLSRLERPAAVGEILDRVEMERRTVLEKLCRLLAVDLVRDAREERDAVREEGESERLVQRLGQRVAEDLARKPLRMDVEEHRRRLKELLNRLGELDHYELLGIELGASAPELHEAYMRLGRLVHPDHAERLGLTQRRAGLELLFERATEAFITLNDPDRSRRYHQRMAALNPGMGTAPGGEARRQEQGRIAERHYKIALGLVEQGDFYGAIQLLEQAVLTDPQAKYLALLGRCEARNPRWVKRAAVTLSRAVQISPEDPQLRAELARVYEEAGNPARAREEYQAALERMPGLPDAVAGLERLDTARPGKAEGQSVMRRLWSRLGRG